jgi:hypothetical protein
VKICKKKIFEYNFSVGKFLFRIHSQQFLESVNHFFMEAIKHFFCFFVIFGET